MACISRFVVAVSNLRNATKSDTAAVSQQRARRTGDVERVRRPRCAKCTQSHLARTRTNAQGTTKKKNLSSSTSDGPSSRTTGRRGEGGFRTVADGFYVCLARDAGSRRCGSGWRFEEERKVKSVPTFFFFSIQSARLKPKLRATICVNSFGGFA